MNTIPITLVDDLMLEEIGFEDATLLLSLEDYDNSVESATDLETLLLGSLQVASLSTPTIESVERYSDLPSLQFRKRMGRVGNGLKVKIGDNTFYITIEE